MEFLPIAHHITRRHEPARLCDGQPPGPDDILNNDMKALQQARAAAILCPTCQLNSGHPPFRLRPARQVRGVQTVAYLYTLQVQDRFDDIRNCPHCRENPEDRNCMAWNEARAAALVLYREARLVVRNTTGILDQAEDLSVTVYRFPDGSVGYLAPEAPPWEEAGELEGEALNRALRALERQEQPDTFRRSAFT